jgi:hypothetical protein
MYIEIESGHNPMQAALVITLVLHVFAIVFWAGSTFTLARFDGAGAETLFGPQMGAAVLAIVTGGVLWGQLHKGPFGPAEQILAAGALLGIVAAGVQGALVGAARRKIAAGMDTASLRVRMTLGNRIAAALLAASLVAMTAVRFV